MESLGIKGTVFLILLEKKTPVADATGVLANSGSYGSKIQTFLIY